MKQQIFTDNEYYYDYELLNDNNNIHTLYFSNSEYWASEYKGEVAFQLKDDGNGLILLTKFDKKNRMDYSEAEYMYILLRIINSNNNYEIGTKKPL